jgi:hypothetical protein
MGRAFPYRSLYQTQRQKRKKIIEDIIGALTSSCARIGARIATVKLATKFTERLMTTHTVAI